jgi:hypothetical protein
MAPDESKLVEFALPMREVQQLRAVLPWLVQALDERPNLNARQRQRRQVTREALSTLLTRINEREPV